MIAWLKAAHIVALIIWCAGLLMLPSIYVHRQSATSAEGLFHLQRFARATFVVIASPAAFVAVATGTVLIFAREVFTEWMAFKLAAVGVLVLLHVRAGFVVLRLFEPDRRFARWRQALATTATVATISVILWLVLAKPMVDLEGAPRWLEPGGLQSLLETIIPIP